MPEVLGLGCAATALGIRLRMTAGVVDHRAVDRTVLPEVAAHTDLRHAVRAVAAHTGLHHAVRAVAVRTDLRMGAVRIDPGQALVDIVQESVDRNRLEVLTDVLGDVGRTAVEVGMNSSILVGSHAGCIGHAQEHYVHILLELELCRIAKCYAAECYAAVKSDHIVLAAAEDCTSSGVIDLHILLRHLGAATVTGIVRTTDVGQTACSLKVVRYRCMFHFVLLRCIRSCCFAKKNCGSLHQGCLQACHRDRQTSAAVESSAVLAGFEAFSLHP